MTEIESQENMWFPGSDSLYKGREGDYARSVIEFSQPEFIELVQRRVEEDGNWVLENGLAEGSEGLMRKMMAWASTSRNITQCFAVHGGQNPTVDWLCRELANAAKKIAEGVRG